MGVGAGGGGGDGERGLEEGWGGVVRVCVFITAGPSTKLIAVGGGILEDMCYDRRRADSCVD